MPRYIYRVRDSQGKIKQGVSEAKSEDELIVKLQEEALIVISITPRETAEKKPYSKLRLHSGVAMDDLILFARQMSTLLDAGVTLLKSLDVLSKQIESARLRRAVLLIKHDIASGSSFRDALSKHPNVFSGFWVQVVETGEASGALPVSLNQLADYLESAADMRRKVTSALVYPAVLISMATIALIVFTVWIIPIFARVFDNFNTKLPLLTEIVITVSNVMQKYFFVFLAGLIALGYSAKKYAATEQGRWQLDSLKLKLPVLAPLFQRIAIERFASGLSTLVESGVPILYGLDIISKAVGNKVIEKAIYEVRESVRQGKGMAAPLEKSGVFTPMAVQMVEVGEEIGELGKMLRKISDFYKERIAATLTKVTTLIEPAVLLFMGVIVGILVIAMFLPIFELATISSAG